MEEEVEKIYDLVVLKATKAWEKSRQAARKPKKQKTGPNLYVPKALRFLNRVTEELNPKKFWEAVADHDKGEWIQQDGYHSTHKCTCHIKTLQMDW